MIIDNMIILASLVMTAVHLSFTARSGILRSDDALVFLLLLLALPRLPALLSSGKVRRQGDLVIPRDSDGVSVIIGDKS